MFSKYLFALFAVTIGVLLTSPSSSYAKGKCTKGLIAYWSFDDSTAKDNSGNGYHGTIIHSPKPITGYNKKGTAFEFTGRGYYSLEPDVPEGDHILLPRIPLEDFDEFTISLWVNEHDFSAAAGEAYLYFGQHMGGWLGIMNHKVPGSENFTLYSQYSVGGNTDTSTVVMALFDNNDLRDRWRQYVLVYNKGLMQCYRNGVLVGSKFSTIKISADYGAIGRHWWEYFDGMRTSARYTGGIDEVKIYCKALTKEEIEKEYQACENADLDELEIAECPKPQKFATITFPSVKTGEETSSVIHIKNRANKEVKINSLTTKNNDFYFKSGTFPVTIAPTATIELRIYFKKDLAGAYQDELKIFDICSEYTFSLHGEVPDLPCKNGLIAYWSFDDSTAKDFSGNGYHGRIINKVVPTIGIYGRNAFRFYGKGENEDTGGHILLPKIDFNKYQEFTLCLWVWNEEPTYYHGESYIAFGDQLKGWLGINNHKQWEYDNTTLYDQFAVGSNHTIDPIMVHYPIDLRNRWIFYSMTYKGGIIKAYRNGKFEGEKSQILNIDPLELGAIARHWWGTYTSTRFNGIIDEVKIYCRALTEEEIKKEYDPCALGLGNEFEVVDKQHTDSILTLKFDSVGVGKQCVRTIKIKNITEVPVILNSIYVAENIHFSIPQSQFPIQFAPQEIKEIEVYLIPKLYGKIRDTLIWDDKCNPWRIALEADSYGTPDTLNGICGTIFEARIDSIKTKYFMSLRSPRYSSSNSLVTVDFETNLEGAPLYRDIEIFNSLGDLVARAQARITYAGNKIINGAMVRTGSLSFSKGDLPWGLYFIKSENGAVGMVIGE